MFQAVVFWVEMLCSVAVGLHPEDRGSKVLQNGVLPQHYMVSQPRRQHESSQPWKPEISWPIICKNWCFHSDEDSSHSLL